MTRVMGKPSLVRQEKEQRRIGTGKLETGRLGTTLGREEVIYLLHSQLEGWCGLEQKLNVRILKNYP